MPVTHALVLAYRNAEEQLAIVCPSLSTNEQLIVAFDSDASGLASVALAIVSRRA